ncbi:terminase large subunit domain-containing protein [Asticcacaulis sp. YBE204]|uniref:phage terminase large subunit family protein n=1 Tax=Asticcacaulis sp. YBE204 TaxID=1282363 RepID=UPI0003C3DC0D|nr:terminase family protein [Asticcacaulis sp. YBE204]ESQ78445.1 hypothetical protein AEYBE204_13180 [Asticcacaulis sp. YBE204]
MTFAIENKAELPEALEGEALENILLGYQSRTLTAIWRTSLLFVDKSRRIGLTFGIASEAALTASSSKAASGNNFLYMGYTQEMAREFINYVAMWAKAFNLLAGEVGEEIFRDPDKPDKDITIYRITFSSGFYVLALPSVPRVLRGKQGILFIDEAAFHNDLEGVLKAAMAFIIWGGRVIVVSTHLGIDNPFNVMLEKIKAGTQRGEVLTITFDDAIADGLYERVLLCGQTKLSKEDYIADVRSFYGDNAAEELDCIPSQGSGSWINAADITACEHADAAIPTLYQGGLTYVGYDVARRNDGIIIHALEKVGIILWLRERWEEVNKKFKEQSDALAAMDKRYRVTAIRIDQTGMGEAVVETQQEKYGATKCQGRLLTGPQRLRLATILRDRFENGTIRIPRDSILRRDLMALKRAGKDGLALVEGKEMHPDRFWALALACEAAEAGEALYDYTPVHNSNADKDTNAFGHGHHDGGMTRHGMSQGGGGW